MMSIPFPTGFPNLAHLDALPGVESRQLAHLIFRKLRAWCQPSKFRFAAFDAVQCDTSHELSDVIFTLGLLKSAAPEARLLTRVLASLLEVEIHHAA